MVRRIREDELPELLALYRLFHPEEESAAASAPATLALWHAILENPGYRYYVFEADGRMVSTCTLTLVANLNHNLRPYGLVENVVTNPAYRGRGCATSVLRQALSEAWDAGCYKVMLLTGSRREETLQFYERAGFQRDIKTGFIAFPPR